MNDDRINVVLPEELKNKIQELAKKKNISLNSIVRIALTEYLERES
jgi:predicted transcriptional regulator